MSSRTLIAQVFAGPYVAEIHHSHGWFLRRYEVEIWGDGDLLCYKLKSAVRETLYDLAARAERSLLKNSTLPSARAEYARGYGQAFIELCRETAEFVSHLSRGSSLESFPGYRLAPDDHHHVFFRGFQEQQGNTEPSQPEHPTAGGEDQMSTNKNRVAYEGAQIIAAASHRNGVSGAPFGVVLFEDDGEDRSRKIGIWFEPGAEGCHCAVLDVDKLAAGDIAFMSNSWRGDLYDPMLRAVVEQIGREEQWRPVFGPDYWKQHQSPGPNLEPKAPQQVTPTVEATRQTEQPILTLVPESRYPTIAWLDLGRFSSKLIAAWNPQSERFTYTAQLFCDDRSAFVPMRKDDLRSLQLLSDDRGLPWLREHLARRGFMAPSIKDLQQFQEIVRVNEALISRFIKQGHKAVLQEQELAKELDVEVLAIEPGQVEQPPTVEHKGEIGQRPRKHGAQVSTLDAGHKGEQHMAARSHQSLHEREQAYLPKESRSLIEGLEDQKSPRAQLGNLEEDLTLAEKEKDENGNERAPLARLTCGDIRGSVWLHQSENGDYLSVSIARVYKAPDGTMKATHSYRLEDLADLSEAALGAQKFMQEESLKPGLKQHRETKRVRITR
jgi:hypothetical protein